MRSKLLARSGGDTERSFRDFCSSAHFKVGAIVRGAQVLAAVHLTGRLDKFPKVVWCRTVDDRVHQNAEFVLHTIKAATHYRRTSWKLVANPGWGGPLVSN